MKTLHMNEETTGDWCSSVVFLICFVCEEMDAPNFLTIIYFQK